ncbi:hypothetical protein CJU90_4437 [Yarrowia sp. C11]|nr:hypothetical protein CKK34_6719 [Yarrowia sp. E02]KAG5365360.1 hypothetical protein CJU90_4437 [Yarrowia sp. C11]
MALIFSFAEVETAVVLREVNTQWYSLFHALDTLLESKMNKRNPWMLPGDGDLKTWQDVALVFAKRLESSKWEETDNIDNAKVTGTQMPSRTVVARELLFDQKLPSSFVCINDGSDCDTQMCEHLHIFSAAGDFSMDLSTLETREELHHYEIVPLDGVETVVKLDGVKFTIPTSLVNQDQIEDVVVGRSCVYVHTLHRGYLVMARNNPHFHSSFFVRSCEPRAAGDLTVLENKDGYRLPDFDNRRLVKYSTGASPVALYNGSVWLLRKNRCLIPTFMDLNTPEKLYFRPDKAITGMYITESHYSQGSKARGSAQFVVGMTVSGVDVVDLAGGSTTTVTHHYGRPVPSKCFVGFDKGKFQAWCMYGKDYDLTIEKVENGF